MLFRSITVTNIPVYSTDAVVQMVFAHILNIYNQVAHYSLEVRNGKWSASKDFCFTDTTLFELHGKKMAIIGLGHIGMAVSKLAIAFGMEILAVTSKKQDQLPEGYKVVDLKTAFKECDILSLHCPLSDDTKHIVNKETLAMMKKNAVIINTGRGPLIDDMALADALNNELIVAAGIDVLTHEPPVPENPLLKAKNCFITPHIAWAAYEARQIGRASCRERVLRLV